MREGGGRGEGSAGSVLISSSFLSPVPLSIERLPRIGASSYARDGANDIVEAAVTRGELTRNSMPVMYEKTTSERRIERTGEREGEEREGEGRESERERGEG